MSAEWIVERSTSDQATSDRRMRITLPAVLAQSEQYAARPDLPQRLTIDFSRVAAVDSSAVALLLDWRRQAKARNHVLEFINLPAALVALARLYGVSDLIQPPAAP